MVGVEQHHDDLLSEFADFAVIQPPQEEDAVESWLLPGSQELHEDAAEREYSPRSQEMHMVAFAALHFPAVQSLQMPLAWA